MDPHTNLKHARERIGSAVRRRFGIDTRALAAFRIALGILLLSDLALRSRDLGAFYTDSGVIPRAALISEFSRPESVSVYYSSGEAWVQAALFLVAGAFAAALLVGYRTSAVTIVSWVLLVSLHNRNPVVLNGGDVLLRMLLFWGIFLPLGERWSIDSRRAGRRRTRVVSVATAAVLLQLVLVYSVNAAFKLSGDLWLSGEALSYVYSLDQFTILLGDVIAEHHALLSVLDHFWLGLLILSPLLILLTGALRAGFVLLFVGAHVGMLLTMRLGLFPLIVIAALLPFLPGTVWDAVVSRLSRHRHAEALGRLPEVLDAALPTISLSDLPPRLARSKRYISTIVPAFFLLLVVLWNVQTLGLGVVPDGADPVVHTTQIDQRWNLFAPDPLRTDGWYVVPARLQNGSRVDALHVSPVRWDRSSDITSTYPNARWRKYLVNLWGDGYAGHRPHLGEYLCQRWNSQHETKMVNLTLYYMEQPSRPYNETEPVTRVKLGEHSCARPYS